MLGLFFFLLCFTTFKFSNQQLSYYCNFDTSNHCKGILSAEIRKPLLFGVYSNTFLNTVCHWQQMMPLKLTMVQLTRILHSCLSWLFYLRTVSLAFPTPEASTTCILSVTERFLSYYLNNLSKWLFLRWEEGAKNWFHTSRTEVDILSFLYTAASSICDPERLLILGEASLLLPMLSQETLTAWQSEEALSST